MIVGNIFYDKDIVGLVRSFLNTKSYYHFDLVAVNQCYLLIDEDREIMTNFYSSFFSNEELSFIGNLKEYSCQNKLRLKLICSNYFDKIHEIESVKISEKKDFLDARIYLNQFSLKSMHRNHIGSVKKAIKTGVRCEIFDSDIPPDVLKDFYDCVVISRLNIGKEFTHTMETFDLRADLVRKNKAFLIKTSYLNKTSYVYNIFSKHDALYLDSGYNTREHPVTAHYAIYMGIEHLKSLGCSTYSLGEIKNKDFYDVGSSTNDSVDFYKSHFCSTESKVYILE